uniref:CCHC-type domain-containing protein n=1 Tax=Strigamia maritima TaxID=126957 RepID=T1ILU3_STRMM
MLPSFSSNYIWITKAEDDLVAANDKLKPVDHVKAYILLSRVGKDFELQIQSIYQWAKDAFTYAKVSEALMLENNRRKLVQSSEAATAYLLNQKDQDTTSSVSSSDNRAHLHNVTCFNCGIKGHYARDCTKVPRSDQPHQGQSQKRGHSRGREKRRSGRRTPGVHAEGHPSAAAWFANAPDSCALPHVCDSRKMFYDFEELQPMRLELGEGSSSITGRDTIQLILQRNLISLGKIDSAKYHIAVYNHSMKVYKSNSRVCSLYGVLENGLYRIQGPVKYRQSNVPSLNESSLIQPGNSMAEPSSANKPENYVVSVNMWHQHFGHMYTKGLNHLVYNANVKDIDLKSKVSKSICDNCELSKSTRAGFKSESLLVASEPLELLHLDLWGPCRIPSLGEARYLFCITDDATRYTWIHPLRSKDQVFETYKRIPVSLAYVHVPKPSRSDKLEPRAWKGVMVGYAVGTRGFRIWDPTSGGVFESKHVKFDEACLYTDVVKTHVGDSPFQTGHDQTPRPARTQAIPPLDTQAIAPPPAAQKFPIHDIPPFVSSRWEREEVQRQTGATKGQSDLYYYVPGLRSRPDIKAWCEVHLKEKYKPNDYDFNPVHAADSDNDDPEQPRTEETETELEPAVDDESTETYAVRVYCASVQEPSTFEEAMSSPESDK